MAIEIEATNGDRVKDLDTISHNPEVEFHVISHWNVASVIVVTPFSTYRRGGQRWEAQREQKRGAEEATGLPLSGPLVYFQVFVAPDPTRYGFEDEGNRVEGHFEDRKSVV